MSHEHLKASWRAEVEAIVRAELGKMEAELARMHHQVEQSFTQLLAQSAARLAAVSQEPAIADFAERAVAHLAALSAVTPPAPLPAQTPAPATEVPPSAVEVPMPPVATVAPQPPPVDLQALYYYLIEIQSQSTQAEVLNLLVTRALEYAPRVALFVVKAGNVVAWTERGFETAGFSLRGLTISLEAQTILFAALGQQTAVVDSPYAYAENQILLDRIGQPPEAMAGIPLLVRGKAAAVLYADSGDQPADRISIPPLQILTNVAGLTVELLNARSRLATTTVPVTDRTTQAMAPPTVTAAAMPPAAVGESQVSPAPVAPAPPATTQPPPDEYQGHVEATTASAVSPPETVSPPEASAVPTAEERQETTTTPDVSVTAESHDAVSPGTLADGHLAEEQRPEGAEPATTTTPGLTTVAEQPPSSEPIFKPEPIPPYVPPSPIIQEPVSPGPVEPPVSSASEPVWTPASPEPQPPASTATSVGRLTGESLTEPSLTPGNGFNVPPLSPPSGAPPSPQPVSVSPQAPSGPPKPTTEEEAKAHNDARRFARLLVSEIKLYNEAKVAEGRLNRDLYDRLKEDIDRSRQMYDKRVNPIVAAKFDYFYDELVSSLAEGDASRLGADCPGPVLVQPE